MEHYKDLLPYITNIVALIIGIAIIPIFISIKELIAIIKVRRDYNKAFDDEDKKLKKFKENGGIHKWVNNVAVYTPDGKLTNTHVCEITGYCPAIDGFVPVERIQQIVKARKAEKEYEEWKEKRIKELTVKFKIEDKQMDLLVKNIISFKQDYHVQKMNEFQQELKDKFGDNVKIVSGEEELKKAIKDLNKQ